MLCLQIRPKECVLTLFIIKRRTPTSIYLPHFNKPKITLNKTGTLYIECFFSYLINLFYLGTIYQPLIDQSLEIRCSLCFTLIPTE